MLVVDIATQDIVEKAEELDREGIRTLGILTKPDLMDKGDELAVIDIMEDRKQQLTLGWHLLRNRGQADLSKAASDRLSVEEKIFKTVAPWTSLPADRVGVKALEIRLKGILADHIRREFQKVRHMQAAEAHWLISRSNETFHISCVLPKRRRESLGQNG